MSHFYAAKSDFYRLYKFLALTSEMVLKNTNFSRSLKAKNIHGLSSRIRKKCLKRLYKLVLKSIDKFFIINKNWKINQRRKQWLAKNLMFTTLEKINNKIWNIYMVWIFWKMYDFNITRTQNLWKRKQSYLVYGQLQAQFGTFTIF